MVEVFGWKLVGDFFSNQKGGILSGEPIYLRKKYSLWLELLWEVKVIGPSCRRLQWF
jgi:hypothetical protein